MIYRNRFLLCLILSLSLVHIIFGTRTAYATSKRIYDEAGLLTGEEIDELESTIKLYEEVSGIEIFILTHNDKKSTYPEKYIEDFEDRLPEADRVYFLYDVYRGEIFMEGYGLAETYIHSKRIDKILDRMVDDLRNGNYFTAFETYIVKSAAYMDDDSELNYDHNYIYDNPPQGFDPNNEYSYDDYDYDRYYGEESNDNILLNIWFQLFASFGIGGIVVGIMAYNSGGKMTAGARDYLDRSRQSLIGKKDHYVRTTVSKSRIPSQSSGSGGSSSRGGYNSGGFRGGRSSGGRSHSSGGRKL
ncbi:TPM domain-containing protein [Herbinix luporum]|jgi:uncharacterized protein|uniref:TPM domain-containing protein n=1 Tax=Herbinix luporum TaxID=1679721 RepID=A0A0K8J2K0_9FIRM|nr:TPM domain-containing protein [Herbinix luporum]MDI9488606.1 TPM domain-containing protein [Bacillota bacterium]CUH91866.1 hypothetical protein SD1D_0313 [Herbinix luporum]HHT57189.1 hypothetical protein [Herbinix luporum]